MASRKADDKPIVRCAIYTRKSTDEGLEKEFNTLDAQREAGEAYIRSQKNEGWICLPDRYDDGGFSGGNLERPALQRLLADVQAGKVDCAVVYKIDRLSRSLMDFAKIVEILDAHSASFVSVTQQFNTKDSMGRLTLNILLSFAQFEREIISERTRDKIAASRRRGKWTGGTPFLGYDVDSHSGRLVVNPVEADQVRQIFNLYLEHRSLNEVVRELGNRGWTSKTWVTLRGHTHQGIPFNKQRLSQLLKNIMYIGKIRYKDEIHEGEHTAIIDIDTWNEVQAQLKKGCRLPDQPRNRYNSLLRGLLHCASCDAPMIHLPVSKKGQKVYRYYVCTNAHTNGYDKCLTPSIPALEIERFVLERLTELGSNHEIFESVKEQVKILWSERIEGMRREERRLSIHIDTLQHGSEPSDQREQRALQNQLHRLRSQIANAETEGITIADCANALGRFEDLLSHFTIDEKSWLLRLVFARIDFDGGTGRIKFHLHDDSLLTAAVA